VWNVLQVLAKEQDMKQIQFVRLLQAKGMKFGFAVDKAGKRWRGFFANREPSDVQRTAVLGSVGICRVCRARVFEGWECLNDKKDACVNCVEMPSTEKIFSVEGISGNDWDLLLEQFYQQVNFSIPE
jgi:hypothetical protein